MYTTKWILIAIGISVILAVVFANIDTANSFEIFSDDINIDEGELL